MKTRVLALAVAATALSAAAQAQSANDFLSKLQACAPLEGVARRDCLDKLSREIPALPGSPPSVKGGQAPDTQPTPGKAPVADTWFVSETTSPFDYSPIAIATATAAAGANGAPMSLSIQCRGGRTDIVVAGAAIQRGPEDAAVSYAINAGAPVPVAVGAANSGNGLVFRLDTVGLVASLPDDGEVRIRVVSRQSGTVEGAFSLSGLAKVRAKIAPTCKWPPAARAAKRG